MSCAAAKIRSSTMNYIQSRRADTKFGGAETTGIDWIRQETIKDPVGPEFIAPANRLVT
jgi:hypothetical protein